MLRPPTGWRMDAAVATTYSLDLNSLLLAPLSMAAYDHAEEGLDGAAPHELLEAIRRYAERTTVFVQAGGIHVPSTYRKLIVFAEDSVIQVPPPPGRVFHPKVWVLRFSNSTGDYRHRFVCLSRNLTGDRSWDTVLSADEEPGVAAQMPAEPLVDFLTELVGMTDASISDVRRALVMDLASTLRGRSFAVPAPFTAGELFPLGTSRTRDWPMPQSVDRSVVISPFLDVSAVRRLPHGTTIISRPAAFDRLGATALEDRDLWVLQPHADAPPEVLDDEADDTTSDQPGEVKSGLHAKILAWDMGGTGHVLTGSANATSAAFGGNIEFGVLLSGPASRCGAAVIMKDSDKETGFVRLLQPYAARPEAAPDVEYELQREIEEFHAALAASLPVFHVHTAQKAFELDLALQLPEVSVGQTWVRPITLKVGYDRALGSDNTWIGLGHSDLTEFVAVRTRLERDGVVVERSCALRARLEGAPADRARRVLRELLSRAEDILRYLALLLRDPSIDDVVSAAFDATNDDDQEGADSRRAEWLDDLVLLEPLARAFARDDDSLDRVAKLFDDLRDDAGRLPDLGEDFENLWRVVSQARQAR